MITLVFLACLPNGYCQSQSPPFVFTEMEECQNVASVLVEQALDAIDRGDMPVQMIRHKCIEWGTPL